MPFVVAVVWVSLSIVSEAPAQKAAPTSPQLSAAGEVFRIDPATSALTPLETVKAKGDSGTYLYCYVEGPSSRVAIPQNEPLVFVVRLDDSPKGIDKYRETPADIYYHLEYLFVAASGRRYGTGKFVDVDVELYGDAIPGINPKKPKKVGQLFRLKPRAPLAPGEYAFVRFGGLLYELGPHCAYDDASAFRIVAATPAAPPAQSQATSASPSAPTNSAADIERLRQAAEKGDVTAQLALAQAYGNGDGVPQNYQQMVRWLSAAADQGSVEGQHWLAVMYRDAVGVAADSTQAAQLFRKAADQGHGRSQASLGHLYYLGQGVLQDYVEAHKWLNIASVRLTGDERKQCVEMRDKVAAVMTPAQIAEAQKRAAEWVGQTKR